MSAHVVLVLVGTRPEAIKMMPVVQALRGAGIAHRLAATGQHRELLDQAFAAFGARPDIDLELMTEDQTPAEVAARVKESVGRLLAAERPALVLVHGDTTTAMATALAAFDAGIPVGHVEAGLRSHDPARPFPEELNRVAIDRVAALCFAPTESAAANLRREGKSVRTIMVTGNTGIDALLQVARRLDGSAPALDAGRRLILVTGHRRENFGAGLEGICHALARLANRGDVEIVWPVHLNPAVRAAVIDRLPGRPHVRLIEPVGYVEMVKLMQAAAIILTDSGGIQEEAPALGRPVLVMRDVTERPEAIAMGAARLVGTDPDAIVRETVLLLDDEAEYASRSKPVFPYGDGQAAGRIAQAVAEFINRQA